ncbi:protocadherin gamma-B5-like [Mizuhopecten yessoensis]|uniref:Protocadherin-11 X-linked n=1 Tax=Mizuhopecten yessoensis TaxID=6573 RepID=A0A210PXR0_MIZYE|nr:protocadherin gamma-B5-like [Mizuhopecten yessoensis]XP_021372414.1 protocadherin gamma-B5-like [Mizuhopecten yessoensis]XP_021372415.1 protocadherin gamma-B5-like [Mizuhopecten yessoensis]XP_021372416.1 protocadherin gamma-B5-like [Mizuhopecten yessoensis]XP_021372418.1 protocadherin gamma-B5-like [Mizuhopecten yessoensis]XP_021372419.1 protocadherin gamma-B5-like [Mizuhopecten yessoensis]OWF41280.1 Protocadherin-11 X-linked [Mizuhopecten yessoensis]
MCVFLPLLVLALTLVSQCQAEIRFTIFEELPIGHEVGNIALAGKFNENRTTEELNALEFSFLETTQNTKYFELNIRTGILTVKKRIDRDAICSVECNLDFEVVIRSSMSQDIFFPSVTVVVEDTNDNIPVFQHTSWKLEIPENAAPNSAYNIIPATDNDTSLQFSIQNYSLSPATTLFTLNVTKKLDGKFLVQLVVKHPLDRELQSFYQMYVTAEDGGPTPNSGKMLVNISVTDLNDNPPIFTKSVYNVTVKEDTLPNTSILQVKATDKDAGENGRVTYRIVPTTDTIIQDLFHIDASTGDLHILTQLTYKPGESYTMITEATDHGDTKKVTQARVNVYVEDSGNNPPTVRINILSGSGNVVSIQESANVGAFVAHVSVEDSDQGENGRVDCVVSSAFFRAENIPPGKGFKILLNHELDRENEVNHSVIVTCHDFGSPVMNVSANFTVSVTDDNDNDPIFLKNPYTARILENNQIGDKIVQVSARDIDEGVNSQVHYYLHSDAGSNFAIQSESGVITATNSFNREQNADFKFKVLAVDRGDPPRTGTASVYVVVEDENDNKPVFNQTIFAFDILENKVADSFVGQVGAIDPDKGDNSRITYYISPQDELLVPFIVFPNGDIRTSQQLDRESQSQYNFVVYATDHGDRPLNSSAYVTVYVMDTNDNDPIIIYPNKTNHTIWSKSGTSLPLTTIQAYDIDEGSNKQLTYYIHEGNDDDMFLLHPESGELFLNSNYPIGKDKSVNLVICVKDGGLPVRAKCAQLTAVITVNNATNTGAQRESTSYITISIVVVIVTVLVSAAIILTIFFLRKIDKNRQKQKYGANGPLGVPMPNSYSSSPASSQQDVNSDAEFMERKKKEVTFSPSTSFDNMNNKGMDMTYQITTDTKPGMYLYDSVPAPETSRKNTQQTAQLNALHLQQLLFKTHQQEQAESSAPPRVAHPSDSNSDTSGETIPSDSGRGGSEDEVPNSHHTGDDSRSFDCGSYNSHTGSFRPAPNIPLRKQKLPPQVQAKISNNRLYPKSSTPTQMFTGPNRPYSTSTEHLNEKKLLSDSNSVQRGQKNGPYVRSAPSHSSFTSPHTQSYLDSKAKSSNFNTWNYLQPNHSVNYSNISKDRDYFNLRTDSISTFRSRDDDDDAATTTSGSYTINPEELEDDLYRTHQDMVV